MRFGALALIGLVAMTGFMDLRLNRDEIAAFDYLGIAVALGLCGTLAAAVIKSLNAARADNVLRNVVRATTHTTSMVFVILIGAALFSLVFRGLGGDETIQALLEDLPGGKWAAVALVMVIMFALGFFLDFIEIIFVVVPIVGPILLAMGVDPVWLGVMMAINLQTSFLTPPFGFAPCFICAGLPPTVSARGRFIAAPFRL